MVAILDVWYSIGPTLMWMWAFPTVPLRYTFGPRRDELLTLPHRSSSLKKMLIVLLLGTINQITISAILPDSNTATPSLLAAWHSKMTATWIIGLCMSKVLLSLTWATESFFVGSWHCCRSHRPHPNMKDIYDLQTTHPLHIKRSSASFRISRRSDFPVINS